MEIDKEKFCCELLIGGYITQVLRFPMIQEVKAGEQLATDFILWNIKVPIGKTVLDNIAYNHFRVDVKGEALSAIHNIYTGDYVKIKAKILARWGMGFASDDFDPAFENLKRPIKIFIDEPEQILVHEVMKRG